MCSKILGIYYSQDFFLRLTFLLSVSPLIYSKIACSNFHLIVTLSISSLVYPEQRRRAKYKLGRSGLSIAKLYCYKYAFIITGFKILETSV